MLPRHREILVAVGQQACSAARADVPDLSLARRECARSSSSSRRRGGRSLMEISDVFGVPAHPLLVHAVVVLVPLISIGAVAAALIPGMRTRIGWIVAAGAALNVVLLPLVTESGESLEARVPETSLVETHAEMGEQLLPWVIALAIAFVAFMLSRRVGRRWVSGILVAATAAAALGATVEVVLIGHSGAQAAWADTAPSGQGDDDGDG